MGRGLRIMESSICVAVMTGLHARLHARMIRFCAIGSSSGGASTPKSPRATISPAEAATISFDTAQCLRLFYLGDDRRVAALLAKPGTQILHIGGTADKGERKVVNLLPQGKGGIGLVLVGDGGHLEAGMGQADPLAREEQAAGHHPRQGSALNAFEDLQLKQTVIEQYAIAGLKIADHLRVGHRDSVRVGGGGLVDQGDGCPRGEGHTLRRQGADA